MIELISRIVIDVVIETTVEVIFLPIEFIS